MSDSEKNLENEIAKLRRDAESTNLRFTQLQSENQTIVQSNAALLSEIETLKKENKELNTSMARAIGNADVALLEEKVRLENDVKNYQLQNKNYVTTIAQLQSKNDEITSKLNTAESTRDRFEKSYKELNEQYIALKDNIASLSIMNSDLQSEIAVARKEVNEVQDKIKTSYTANDLSNYLSKTISDFNKNSESDEGFARYVINSMDIDLKAQVFHDENNNLKFCAPKIEKSTENSLSSIKISIRAIPKQ
jgi:Chromosome segregation ATPases